ncbi:TolB family protein, partial [Streptacidiphilus monticola]
TLTALGTTLVLHAADRSHDGGTDGTVTAGQLNLDDDGQLLFLDTAAGTHHDEVVAAHADGSRTGSGLDCLRFYAAAGTGVCLQAQPGALQTSYRARILDARLRTVRSFPLAGVPSRARVSPSGRFAAWTVFVGGESYGSAFFSTRTSIVDTRTGQLDSTLEDFAVDLNGAPYRATDENFWGVTFAADDDTFYATLATGGRTYLVKGSIGRRTVSSVGVTNVECPSLSPDGTRIAFKRRVLGSAALWHEYVLDLRTLKQTPLAESHSVDDQAFWLDDRTVAYALPTQGETGSTDLWSVPADGSGTPALLAGHAASPARS